MINTISTSNMSFLQSGVYADNTKTYSSLEEFNSTFVQYGKEQTKTYSDKFAKQENGGTSSVEELKNEIKKEFGAYKLVSSEPSDVVDGQHLLYIDDKNLQKMANDPEYKAKVFGLMRRELDSMGSNKIKMGGEVVNFSMTGSVFSLSDSNESVDGIPYKGSGKSVSFSTSSTKTSNALGSSNDWFEELMEKLKKKREEEKRESEKKEKAELNIYA